MFQKPTRNCPLCGSDNISDHYTIDSFKDTFKISRCNSCFFQFMNPIFTEKYLSELYSEDYYKGKADYTYTDERNNFNYNKYVWNARINKIRSYIPSGNFLDIGCSFGGLLKCASGHFNTFGIEISNYSAEYASSNSDSNIFNGTLEQYSMPDNTFDIITMIELIEHLPDPVKTVQKCRQLLKKNGLLVIQTADMEAIQAITAGKNYHYYLPGHVSYFSSYNLTLLLNNCGFNHIKIYRPVDFGLIPKLLKSRGSFKSIWDYFNWFRISYYHFKGYIKYRDRPLTSSMVVYAY